MKELLMLYIYDGSQFMTVSSGTGIHDPKKYGQFCLLDNVNFRPEVTYYPFREFSDILSLCERKNWLIEEHYEKFAKFAETLRIEKMKM